MTDKKCPGCGSNTLAPEQFPHSWPRPRYRCGSSGTLDEYFNRSVKCFEDEIAQLKVANERLKTENSQHVKKDIEFALLHAMETRLKKAELSVYRIANSDKIGMLFNGVAIWRITPHFDQWWHAVQAVLLGEKELK